MSQRNVEVVKSYFEARNRHDRAAMRALLDPEIEWDMSRSIAPYGGGVTRGLEAVMELWESFAEAWADGSFEPEEFVARGEDVVVPVRSRGRGRGSGVEHRARGAGIWTVRDRKIVRFELFQTRDEALAAAGSPAGEHRAEGRAS